MRFGLWQLMILVFCGLFSISCSASKADIGSVAINVQETTIVAGDQRPLSVNVVGPADIQFEWSKTAGTLSNSSAQSVVFTAPGTPGTVLVSVKVTSGDQAVTDSITFDVIPPTPTETPTAEPTSTPIPSLTPTNTPILTDTPTPTNTDTPTPIPDPIECNDSKIVPGIFAQLAQEATFSFVGSNGDNVTFECEGVFDRFNIDSPAVRIDYEKVINRFGFFSIGISEGFDVSHFSKICVMVYAEAPSQQLDLKLEDANRGEGSKITTTKTGEWEEHCVLLDGYPEVDLMNITAITLSFNDDFGSATIWVDDFELR